MVLFESKFLRFSNRLSGKFTNLVYLAVLAILLYPSIVVGLVSPLLALIPFALFCFCFAVPFIESRVYIQKILATEGKLTIVFTKGIKTDLIVRSIALNDLTFKISNQVTGDLFASRIYFYNQEGLVLCQFCVGKWNDGVLTDISTKLKDLGVH